MEELTRKSCWMALAVVYLLHHFPSVMSIMITETCGILHLGDLEVETFIIPKSSDDPTPAKLYYRLLYVDNSSDSLFVGGMNNLIRLRLSNISNVYQNNRFEAGPDQEKLRYCFITRPTSPDCQNHIKFIGNYNMASGNLYFCGTNAYSPKSYVVRISDLSIVEDRTETEKFNPELLCPNNPFQNATSIYVENGNPQGLPALYTANRGLDRPFIFRMLINYQGDSPLLKTILDGYEKWLNDPEFVDAIDMNDVVLIFYREVGIEFTNCEKRVVSRVAKVCKSDVGGSGIFNERWTSFQKARLNCSIAGEYPSYFDKLQDIRKIGNVFYGLFTTNVNGIAASAICEFSMEEINAAFSGKYKEQETPTSNWLPVDRNKEPNWPVRPPECYDDTKSLDESLLTFVHNHPLMDKSVQHKNNMPLFYKMDVHMTKLQVAYNINGNSEVIFFTSTSDGEVYKIFLRGKEGILSSVYKVFSPPEPIWAMELRGTSLFVGADTAVKQINIVTCKYDKIDTCIYDPYCAWDNIITKCQVMQKVFLTDTTGRYQTYKDISTLSAGSPKPVEKTRNEGSSVIFEVKYNLCTAHKNIRWKYRDYQSADSKFVVLTNNYFMMETGALFITDLKKNMSGTYTAEDNGVVLSHYNLNVIEETDIEEIWKQKFEEWCDEFEKQKQIRLAWEKACIAGGV